ncbi:Uncharacterised protein [Mycobacteroides abscessus subsp. abscessus]|nr:Uncharacterised protein [Mycobacteroides abscessus subsp. abscessus]
MVRWPCGYIASAFGANTSSTPSSRNFATSESSVRGYASRSSPGPNCSGLTKMDTTTTAPGTFRACRTSVRWPSCSAPMVGTKTIRRPVCRNAFDTSYMVSGSW